MAVLAEWHEGPTLPTTVGGSIALRSYDDVWPLQWIGIDHNGAGPASVLFPADNEPQVAIRTYFRTPAVWPTALLQVAQMYPTPEMVGGADIGLALSGESNPGQCRIRVRAAGGGTTDAALSPVGTLRRSTWYRLELQVDHLTDRVRAGVARLHRTAFDWSSPWVPSNVSGSSVNLIALGAAQGSLLLGLSRLAHITITDQVSSWIGRHSSDVVPFEPVMGDISALRYYSGSGLTAPAGVYVWEGDALYPAVDVFAHDGVDPEPEPDPEDGTLTAQLTFEGLTDNTPVTVSPPWTVATFGSGAVTALTAAALSGSMGARVDASGVARLEYTLAGGDTTDTVLTEAQVRLSAVEANLLIMRRLTTGGAIACDVRVNPNRTITLRNGMTAVATSTETVDLNTPYRFAWLVRPGSQELRVFPMSGDTPLFTINALVSDNTHGQCFFGTATTSAGTVFDLDRLRVGTGWLA